MTARVVVCLSGGVDSSVAAALLQEAGHDIAAITFWFGSFPDATDAARDVADRLGIVHQRIDASEPFRRTVVDDFVASYRRGKTPNPCGVCNRELRFGLALDYADRNGFDLAATGHHVRRRVVDGRINLHRGADPAKDQSYFLYGLTQPILKRLLFPVGEMTKAEAIAYARRRGLPSAERPESQDLCFALGERVHLFASSDLTPGPIVDTTGRRLGTHRGLPRYTVGQRRGLGIPSDRPLYVLDLDPGDNTLVVGEEASLYRSELSAVDASYISGRPPEAGLHLGAKIRYRSPIVGATYHPQPGGRFRLVFDTAQRAVTPGQLAVLYGGDRLLGGGTIVHPSRNARAEPV